MRSPGRRLEHDRPRAVAEEDARGPIIPVEDAGEGLGPDHEGALVGAGAQEVVGGRNRIDEAAADRLQVERRPFDDAEIGLDLGRDRRKRVVGRRGRHDHEVDVRRLKTGLSQRGLRSPGGQGRGCLAFSRDIALPDAGALLDPLVRGVDLLGELRVGDDPVRKRGADAADAGAKICECHETASVRVTSGRPRTPLTGAPRRPARPFPVSCPAVPAEPCRSPIRSRRRSCRRRRRHGP